MDDLIESLALASSAVSSAAGKAAGEKMRKQLLVCALDLRNLAIELRRGSATIPEGAMAVCAKELRETLAAAKSAKSEDGLGRLLAEAAARLAAADPVAAASVPAAALAVASGTAAVVGHGRLGTRFSGWLKPTVRRVGRDRRPCLDQARRVTDRVAFWPASAASGNTPAADTASTTSGTVRAWSG